MSETRPLEPWERADTVSYPDMNYLLSEAARSRYLIAAHHVRDCVEVVEIGGFKTPITAYLTQIPARVQVVDPLITEYRSERLRGRPCQVLHLAHSFQQHDFELPDQRYGLVLLGLSLKHFSDQPEVRAGEWLKLRELVRRSRVAVLEWAVEWPLGRASGEQLLAEVPGEVVLDMELDLQRSPGMVTEHQRRRLVVLRPLHAPR
jgi:hypothetical protein